MPARNSSCIAAAAIVARWRATSPGAWATKTSPPLSADTKRCLPQAGRWRSDGVACMALPPPLPSTGKNLRLARWLNVALPGAGLFYLGRRRLGVALAVPFLACFFAAFSLFLVSYGRYLSLAMG